MLPGLACVLMALTGCGLLDGKFEIDGLVQEVMGEGNPCFFIVRDANRYQPVNWPSFTPLAAGLHVVATARKIDTQGPINSFCFTPPTELVRILQVSTVEAAPAE